MGDSLSVTSVDDQGVATLQQTTERVFPVVEVFGPTIQGEGPDAGLPVYFIRFGLCDYRCAWCDSMFAVDPAQVREHSTRLTAAEIMQAFDALHKGAGMVVLSGGNPAVHDLQAVVDGLHDRGLWVSVETQGSIWRPWLARVDRLVVSPKPPSSTMATERHHDEHVKFMEQAQRAGISPTGGKLVLKYVVFDEDDLEWAIGQAAGRPCFFSVGTDQGRDPLEILIRFRWLANRVLAKRLANVKVLPQLHVLIWGHERGV